MLNLKKIAKSAVIPLTVIIVVSTVHGDIFGEPVSNPTTGTGQLQDVSSVLDPFLIDESTNSVEDILASKKTTEDDLAKLEFVLRTKQENYNEYVEEQEAVAEISKLETQFVQASFIEEAKSALEEKAAENEKKEAEEAARLQAEAEKVAKMLEALPAEQRASVGYTDASQYVDAPLNVPNDDPACRSWFKTYMDYRAVKTEASAQYKLLNSADAYTDQETGFRMVSGRYCIALGSGFTHKIGAKIDIVLEDGSVLPCILGDAKSDRHTDAGTHKYHVGGWDHGRFYPADGSVVEFITDSPVFNSKKDSSGTVNSVLKNSGKVMKVIVLD